MQKFIDQFMWAYQHHFRTTLQIRADMLFDLLGAQTHPRALLVGMRRPGSEARHAVCIEPEDRDWSLSAFDGLEESVEQAVASHPLQMMFYSDERTTLEKPQRIRNLAIGEEVRRRLETDDRASLFRTFCSAAYPVGDYHVVCSLQLPAALFRQFPSVELEWQNEPYETSLILECVRVLLEEGRRALSLPEPGRSVIEDAIRSADEIARRGAANFMRSPFIAGKFCTTELFQAVNRLSQLLYEGEVGAGRMILTSADDPNIEYVLRLQDNVFLREPRWARKLLQMASGASALIAEYDRIVGLGRVSDLSGPSYAIEFLDHHRWDLLHGDQVFLRSQFGEPRLPQEAIDKDRFTDNMRRVFKGIDDQAVERLKNVLEVLVRLPHGSSLVIAEDAAEEAKRFARQGTVIEPTPITRELLERATAIDGTVLADPVGVCHAIGIILDGQASEESTPSRGARYNSAVRYVHSGSAARMAFVVSEDRTVDIIPMLRPRISRNLIQEAVAQISNGTRESYFQARSFLDRHRFYLDADQCRIVNEALDRIEAEKTEVGEIKILTSRFEPHPAFDQSYLTDAPVTAATPIR